MRRVIIQMVLLATLIARAAQAQGHAPAEAAGRMSGAEGLEVRLVAAEPLVRQPVAIELDDRGWIWVIQYMQYPNPAQLKRVAIDRYSRTVKGAKMTEHLGRFLGFVALAGACLGTPASAGEDSSTRVYENRLKPIADPQPILADFPQFVEPVREVARFEAPILIDDPGADLDVRAWRFSYNARGIIEVPNRLRADRTAVIVVHPWGIDDGQGWRTPEPAGVAFQCTPAKNKIVLDHAATVINPFLKSTARQGPPGGLQPPRHRRPDPQEDLSIVPRPARRDRSGSKGAASSRPSWRRSPTRARPSPLR